METKNPRIICLMGPTATGKTNLAIKLTQSMPVDIVSVDSAMVYRGMDIGSAKPSKEELAQAPHRLIDIREPWESYSAADFRADALEEIENILQQGRTPLLVGGTMLYFKVLQQGIADLPSADPDIRERLQAQAEIEGWESLHMQLQKVDPESSERIHQNDPQRLLRALEVYEITGEPLSKLWREHQAKAPAFEFINIALQLDRDILRERIAARFQQMLTQGLIEEVKQLKAIPKIHADLPAIKAVGYQQVWQHLNDELNQDEMIERAITLTRRFAKRQMTWLRSWPELTWFDALDENLPEKVSALIIHS